MSNNAWNTPIPARVQDGMTGATSFTAYSPIAAGTTNNNPFQSVGTGTTGQILSSQGSSALPLWIDNPAADIQLISTQNIPFNTPVSSVSFTNIPNTYNNFVLYFSNLTEFNSSVGDINPIVLKISTNNGSTYIASGYLSNGISFQYNSNTRNRLSPTTSFTIGNFVEDNALGKGTSGVMYLNDFTSSYYPSTFGFSSADGNVGSGPGYCDMTLCFGVYTTSVVVNALKINVNSGSPFYGIFSLYGVLE